MGVNMSARLWLVQGQDGGGIRPPADEGAGNPAPAENAVITATQQPVAPPAEQGNGIGGQAFMIAALLVALVAAFFGYRMTLRNGVERALSFADARRRAGMAAAIAFLFAIAILVGGWWLVNNQG